MMSAETRLLNEFVRIIADRGILMTFGSGTHGSLGHGNFQDVAQAKIVEALLGYEVQQVTCGASHIIVVTADHELFSWGRGDNGRLGLGNEETYNIPQPVTLGLDFSPCAAYCGIDSSVVLTVEEVMFACGSNRCNKLALDQENGGRGARVEECLSFVSIPNSSFGNKPIRSVALGSSHTAAVTFDGKLYTYGSNSFGQLGYQREAISREPQVVESLEEETVHLLACGDTFTVVVTSDQQVFTWGKAARGRLGHEIEENLSVPKLLDFPDISKVLFVSCSQWRTLLSAKLIKQC